MQGGCVSLPLAPAHMPCHASSAGVEVPSASCRDDLRHRPKVLPLAWSKSLIRLMFLLISEQNQRAVAIFFFPGDAVDINHLEQESAAEFGPTREVRARPRLPGSRIQGAAMSRGESGAGR